MFKNLFDELVRVDIVIDVRSIIWGVVVVVVWVIVRGAITRRPTRWRSPMSLVSAMTEIFSLNCVEGLDILRLFRKSS